jgi:hypothetical protein
VEKQNKEWKSDEASSLEEARGLLNRWRRRAIVLGTGLLLSVASVIPFLEGHFLHAYADRIGRYLIYLSGCLLTAFAFSAAQAYNFWIYLRDLKKAYRSRSADP